VPNSGVFAQLESMIRSEPFSVTQPLSSNSRFSDIDEWDSFQHLRFLLEVEDRFGFEISPEQGEAIETLGDLAQMVAAN